MNPLTEIGLEGFLILGKANTIIEFGIIGLELVKFIYTEFGLTN